MKRIYRYIIKEFLPSYLLGFTFFSIFLLVQLLFQIVDLYVSRNAPLGAVLELLLYGTAWCVSFSIPIASIMGTVLSLGRISGDSEVIAMRANGISLYNIFKPLFIVGVLLMLFNIVYYEYIYPWGMQMYYQKYMNMGVQDPTTQLSEDLIYENTDSPYVIQVDNVERGTRELINVKISSVKDNKLILADRGKFLEFDEDREIYRLLLENTITQPLNPGKEKDETDAKFYEMRSDRMILNIPFKIPDYNFTGSYVTSWSFTEIIKKIINRKTDYSSRIINKINQQAIELNEIKSLGGEVQYQSDKVKVEQGYKLAPLDPKLSTDKKKSINSSFNELRKDSRTLDNAKENSDEDIPPNYLLELHKKLSYSFSCLMFIILGAPLSVSSARSGKSYGLGISLLFIAIWYGAYFLSERMLGSMKPVEFLFLKIDLSSPIIRAWLPPGMLVPFALVAWYNKVKA